MRGPVTRVRCLRGGSGRFSTADSSRLCLGPNSRARLQPGSYLWPCPRNLLGVKESETGRKREGSRAGRQRIFRPHPALSELGPDPVHSTASPRRILTRLRAEPRFLSTWYWKPRGHRDEFRLGLKFVSPSLPQAPAAHTLSPNNTYPGLQPKRGEKGDGERFRR